MYLTDISAIDHRLNWFISVKITILIKQINDHINFVCWIGLF